MRLLFADTETTGLSPKHDHRIIEIACVEMIDGELTGRDFHSFLNPGIPVPEEAIAIHGITDSALKIQPRFAEIADDLDRFVSGSRVVMHNAPFDKAFFSAELDRVGRCIPSLTSPDFVIDTLPLFRKLNPGKNCSLAALCERHEISPPEDEDWHSALTDARMLARLWLAAGLDVRGM